MVTINGKKLYEKPTSCRQCPFFYSGSTEMQSNLIGHCLLFNEWHKYYIEPPRRCQKLFNKAFREYDGRELIIVKNEESEAEND